MSVQSSSQRATDPISGAAAQQKIVPFLWFDGNAEEAINFYVSLFKNSRILSVSRSGDTGPLFSATFQLDGQEFMALNGGPKYKFTEAISLFVKCETQEEVDELWEKILANGGKEQQCGWIKDRFGLSWQIIPNILGELMGDKDPEKSKRVMAAILQMVKIDSEALKRAHAGK
jgi:predicted 3-demethylubiquinone-9 3-methyltransferase (glyoxalase superfamily)